MRYYYRIAPPRGRWAIRKTLAEVRDYVGLTEEQTVELFLNDRLITEKYRIKIIRSVDR